MFTSRQRLPLPDMMCMPVQDDAGGNTSTDGLLSTVMHKEVAPPQAPASQTKPGRFANLRAKLAKPSEHAEVNGPTAHLPAACLRGVSSSAIELCTYIMHLPHPRAQILLETLHKQHLIVLLYHCSICSNRQGYILSGCCCRPLAAKGNCTA